MWCCRFSRQLPGTRSTTSMPLGWNELDQTAPDAFTMDDALARIDGDDPWDGYFDVDQALE